MSDDADKRTPANEPGGGRESMRVFWKSWYAR